MKTLKFVTSFAFLAISCFPAPSQEGRRLQKSTYVVAPSENTLLTVASQPSCPLVIEDAQTLLNVDKSWAFRFSYGLRNRGNKPIRDFTIHFWTSESSGGTLSDSLTSGTLGPGQRIARPLQEEQGVIVPLTDDLREKLKVGLPMKMVVVIMVEDVEFADGSKYSDEKTLNALKDYFENRCR